MKNQNKTAEGVQPQTIEIPEINVPQNLRASLGMAIACSPDLLMIAELAESQIIDQDRDRAYNFLVGIMATDEATLAKYMDMYLDNPVVFRLIMFGTLMRNILAYSSYLLNNIPIE